MSKRLTLADYLNGYGPDGKWSWTYLYDACPEAREAFRILVERGQGAYLWRTAGRNGVMFAVKLQDRPLLEGEFRTPEEAYQHGCKLDPRWIGHEEEAGLVTT